MSGFDSQYMLSGQHRINRAQAAGNITSLKRAIIKEEI